MLMEKPQSAYDLQKNAEAHKLSRWGKVRGTSVSRKILQREYLLGWECEQRLREEVKDGTDGLDMPGTWDAFRLDAWLGQDFA